VFTVDLNEGILLQSEDTETEDVEEITVMSRESDVDRVDEDSKRILRDQLRRTLSRKGSRAGGVFYIFLLSVLQISPDIVSPRSPAKGKLPQIPDIDFTSGNWLDALVSTL
jgi:hypothetical protein